jgi:hypothetical protein
MSKGVFLIARDDRPAVISSSIGSLGLNLEQFAGAQLAEYGRVVDAVGEQHGSIEGASVAESSAMQLCADEELVHARPCGDRLEVAHPSACLRSPELDGGLAEGVETVRMHPEVRVRDPDTAGSCIVEPGNGLVHPTVRKVDQPETPGGDPLPARIGDLAAERKGGFEGCTRLVNVTLCKVDGRQEGLRKGKE